MVRLYYLAVIRKTYGNKSEILNESCDLADFGYFRRNAVHEFMRFSSLTLAARTEPESSVSVRENIYVCHVFAKRPDLAAAAVTDDEYPPKAAHMCLKDLLNDFEMKVGRRFSRTPADVSYQGAANLMAKWRAPSHVDRLWALQCEVDETRIVLHDSLESVLRRGENLDELISKTDELSTQAKAFYKTARKTNACCKAL